MLQTPPGMHETSRSVSPEERYLPIKQHAVIGDRRTAAMVGANGTIDWWCLPNFDGDVVFGALLDAERGGHWKAGPESGKIGTQEYIKNTAVVQTTWSTGDRELELVDAMLWPDRGVSDPRAEQRVMLRRLRCLRGKSNCMVELAPRNIFGSASAVKGPLGWRTGASGDHWLGFWTSDSAVASQIRADSRAVFHLNEGQSVWMILGEREEPGAWTVERAEAALDETIASWSNWVKGHPFFGPRRDAVLRSVITIRLLSFQPNGAQVAAPTCSLPEKIGSNRNYDYRYAWIRDSSLALAIVSVMGDLEAAEKYMDWLARLGSSNDMPLQVFYGIDGRCHVPESEFDGLDGYRGSKPVRFGNHAFNQFQLDSLGYLADCSLIYLQQGGPWKPEYWKLIERIADYTAANWQRKDSGIWELSQERHYVSSKAMSWVVLERACRIADELPSVQAPAHWHSTMDAIHAQVMDRGWSESRQAFRQHYDSDDLDASVLLLATMGFLPADHPRIASTVAAIRTHLEQDGFVWRFHPCSLGHPGMPLDGMESAFLPCTFWLASALSRVGQEDEAERILDKVDAMFAQLGIFPEEADPHTGAALGNMPLLFSHAEHLKAVMDYAKAKPMDHLMLAAGMMARKALGMIGSA
jgi:GH15 family glucan-1,4-alpha-glucosidase